MKTGIRKPAAERREEILGTVCRLIGERGLSSLTTTVLAEEIGVTSGALFRHFASRDEILDGAVRYALERIGETFPDASLPPLERLLQLGRNRIALFQSEPGIAWLLRSEEASLSLPPDAVERLRELVERSGRYLLETIREGVAVGSIRNDIEPEHLRVLVMGTIHALAGMPGLHREARKSRRRDPEPVLTALARMLAAPARTTRTKPSTTKRSSTRR
jgi:TetR/AcrR family transcriptional regulator